MLRLYSAKFSPNPRRVEIFIKEKQIDSIEIVRIDMGSMQHKADDYLQKNPLGLLPTLELENGEFLTESMAICEYLEDLFPSPNLFGESTWQRARTREANRIAEFGLLLGASQAFQHSSPFFAGRWEQLPQNVEEGQRLFVKHLKLLDRMLKKRIWLAGDQFSVADITAICAIDFGKVSGCRVNPELEHINRWLGDIRERPSCQIRSRKKK